MLLSPAVCLRHITLDTSMVFKNKHITQEVESETKNKSHKNQTKETYGKIMKSGVRVECSSGGEIPQSL